MKGIENIAPGFFNFKLFLNTFHKNIISRWYGKFHHIKLLEKNEYTIFLEIDL